MAEILQFPRPKEVNDHWHRAFEHYNIPDHTQHALIRYIDDHIAPGHFLQAVLRNDLFEAMAHADIYNRLAMGDICKFIYNHAPSAAWGDAIAVSEWINGREF
jgi:hypothetical protein